MNISATRTRHNVFIAELYDISSASTPRVPAIERTIDLFEDECVFYRSSLTMPTEPLNGFRTLQFIIHDWSIRSHSLISLVGWCALEDLKYGKSY